MKPIVRLLLAFLFASGAMTGSAFAAEREAYSAALFAKAQAEGKPILIDIAASWCPVCKVQASAIERDLSKPEFSEFVLFDVDFDTQKIVVRQFGASMQSTLIVFKGKKETARLIGITDPDVIEAMLRRAAN